MEDDSPDSISTAKKTLELAREKAVTDLQKTVHQRCGDFVQVTKELASFETKMNELHGIVNQLSMLSETLLANVPHCSDTLIAGLGETGEDLPAGVPSDNRVGSGTATTAAAGVDLVERRAKINRILEHVSDLDEYLSESTGRHIVFEGVDVRYNSSAGKSAKAIYFYLLNDSVLATSKKASRNPLGNSGKRKYGLEFCLDYSELSFEDVKEPIQDANGKTLFGIKLSKGKTEPVGTIMLESAANKKLYFDQLKKAVIGYKMEEAARNSTLHLQPVKERYVKKANRSSLAARAGHRRAASSSAHRKAAEHAVATAGLSDVSDEMYSKLLYFLDDLDQASSLRKYNEATDLVEQVAFNLNQISVSLSDSPRLHSIRQGLEAKKRRLAELLLAEISSFLVSRDETVKYVQLLLVLGYTDAARERFLTARSDQLRKDMRRSIDSLGNSKQTVLALSDSVFANIKTTADWYRAAFNDPVRMSGLVFWARIEILELGNVLAKLLLATLKQEDMALVAECMALIREKAESLLEVGLNLTFILDDCFAKPLSEAMNTQIADIKATLVEGIKTDDFETFVAVNGAQVSASAGTVHDLAKQFMESFTLVVYADLSPLLADRLGSILECACKSYVERFSTMSTSSKSGSVICNPDIVSCAEFVADALFSSLYLNLSQHFERDFPSLKKLQQRLLLGIYAMYDILTETSSASWLPETWACYQDPVQLSPDNASVSQWIMQMLPQVCRLTRESPPSRRPHLLSHLVLSVINQVSQAIESGSIEFVLSGHDQFHLDFEYLRLVCVDLDSHRIFDSISALEARASVSSTQVAPSRVPEWIGPKAEALYSNTAKPILNFGLNGEQ